MSNTYPKLPLIPRHQRANIPAQAPQLHGHRCCCLRAKASPNFRCSSRFQPGPGRLGTMGEQSELTPTLAWQRTGTNRFKGRALPKPTTSTTSGGNHKEQSTHWGKFTGYPTSSGQNHWETTCRDHYFSAATPSHAGEVFKFTFSRFTIQTSDCKEQPTML